MVPPSPSPSIFSQQIAWRGIPPIFVCKTQCPHLEDLLIVICLQAELAQFRRHNLLDCISHPVLYQGKPAAALPPVAGKRLDPFEGLRELTALH